MLQFLWRVYWGISSVMCAWWLCIFWNIELGCNWWSILRFIAILHFNVVGCTFLTLVIRSIRLMITQVSLELHGNDKWGQAWIWRCWLKKCGNSFQGVIQQHSCRCLWRYTQDPLAFLKSACYCCLGSEVHELPRSIRFVFEECTLVEVTIPEQPLPFRKTSFNPISNQLHIQTKLLCANTFPWFIANIFLDLTYRNLSLIDVDKDLLETWKPWSDKYPCHPSGYPSNPLCKCRHLHKCTVLRHSSYLDTTNLKHDLKQ